MSPKLARPIAPAASSTLEQSAIAAKGSLARPRAKGACVDCGAATGHRRCLNCWRKRRGRTPVRRWCEERDRSLRWLAERARVPYRTVQRIAAGEKASGENALRIHEVTKIPIETLIRGTL